MYFIKRGDKYIDVSGKSFKDFFAGKLDALPGERPTISDWANHLSTIFPEVRLKRYLEMRGADGGPWRRLPALVGWSAHILGIGRPGEALRAQIPRPEREPARLQRGTEGVEIGGQARFGHGFSFCELVRGC